MTRKKFTIIAYDITDDGKRTKVSTMLERYGTRRNKSVFECMVTESQLKKITAEIHKRIEPQTDTVLIYRICLNCYVLSEIIGKQSLPLTNSTIVIV